VARKKTTKKTDELERLRSLWQDAVDKTALGEFEVAHQRFTELLEIMPTLGPAYGRRANVREHLGDTAGEAADRKRAKELAAAAAQDAALKAAFDAVTKAPVLAPVKNVKMTEHTMGVHANYYCAPATADELASAGLSVTGTGKVRVVFGVRETADGFEAAMFGEIQRGRSWKLATKELVGTAAEACAAQLAEKHRQFEDLPSTINDVLDGFEEQAGYAAAEARYEEEA
jgi:hypothetical protein